MKFRKKPVVIEAEQFLPGDGVTDGDSFEAHGTSWRIVFDGWADRKGPYILIKTLEGAMACEYGDWVIKGVKGELYPCKPDIFELIYEPAEQP